MCVYVSVCTGVTKRDGVLRVRHERFGKRTKFQETEAYDDFIRLVNISVLFFFLVFVSVLFICFQCIVFLPSVAVPSYLCSLPPLIFLFCFCCFFLFSVLVSQFDESIKSIPELKALLSRAQDEIHPMRAMALFERITTEVRIYLF